MKKGDVFKKGARVRWEKNGEVLTGTFRYYSEALGDAIVECDQTEQIGGVITIMRIEHVLLPKLELIEEED